jgi:hypothetical protein
MNEELSEGTYYLGDPAFVLEDSIYIGVWGNQYNYSNGKINVYGTDFVVHNTHNGDGKFLDNKNRVYHIESGTIALIPTNLIKKMDDKVNNHTFKFEEKVNFIYDRGIFYIRSNKKYVKIDTRNMDEYDSEFEDHALADDKLEDSDDESIIELSTKDNKSDDEEEPDTETPKKFKFFKV